MMSAFDSLMEKMTISGDDFNDSYWYGIFDNYTDDDRDSGTVSVCDLDAGMQFKAAFIPALYSVVFFIGVLGNGALLGVLFRTRRQWSVTDTFILHLCISDVLLLLTLPLWASEAVSGWGFGTPLCKITGFVFTINFYCGIFLLACISLDRYASIVHATQMYSRRNPLVVQFSCLLMWLLSLLLSIPDWMFLKALKDERRNITECMHNYLMLGVEALKTVPRATRIVHHIVGFLIPSVILVFCYSCILLRIRCGTHSLQKQRASRVIFAVVAVFFICWTPYNVTLIFDTLNLSTNNTCEGRNRMEQVRVVTQSLSYLHCSLNPILYAFVGVKFRRQLLDILRALGCNLKTTVGFQSGATSRKSSMWSESGETSNSIAV